MARHFNETFKPPCCIHLANPMTLPSSSPGWSHVARHGHHNPILTNFWPVLSSLYHLPSLHHPISKPLHFRRPGLALTLPLAADNFPFSYRKRRPSLAAPRPPEHLRDILSSCAQVTEERLRSAWPPCLGSHPLGLPRDSQGTYGLLCPLQQ